MAQNLLQDIALYRPQLLLRDRVAVRLREAMIAGRYEPGERLLEKELCVALGVSRTSVREALRQLEIEGMVAVGPRGRPFVANMTPEIARKIYEFREILECAAGRLFIARAPDEAFMALSALSGRFWDAMASGDLSERLAVKSEFYDILFIHAGNPDMQRVFDQLFNRIGFLRYRSLGQQVRAEARAAELQNIVARLIARDEAGTVEALSRHIREVGAAAVLWLDTNKDNESR